VQRSPIVGTDEIVVSGCTGAESRRLGRTRTRSHNTAVEPPCCGEWWTGRSHLDRACLLHDMEGTHADRGYSER
jgi:hypothetical protein